MVGFCDLTTASREVYLLGTEDLPLSNEALLADRPVKTCSVDSASCESSLSSDLLFEKPGLVFLSSLFAFSLFLVVE